MEKEPRRYEIDSFDRLINVATKENVERLAIDLAGWLIYVTEVFDGVRLANPTQTKGKLNSEIAKAHFVWVDDDKHELKGTVLTNSQTGETKHVNFSKK